MTVSKNIAVQRLQARGYTDIAAELQAWSGKNGNGGWDLWFRAKYPALAVVVWP